MQNISTLRSVLAISKVYRIAFGVAILFISAQLTIPLTPVPLTFQAATAILLALTLPRLECFEVVMTYLLMGSLGAPVFAGFSGGLHIIFGPSGGYLLGFIPAAFMASFITQLLPKHFMSYLVAAILGSMVLFTTGFLQLSHLIGFAHAYAFGLKPFFIVEPIKLFFVALVAAKANKIAR